MAKVKVTSRRRGTTRISAKNQITIPVETLREAGLSPGEQLVAHADGSGRIVFERQSDIIDRYAGTMTGVYEPGYLDKLRDEWD